MILPNKYTKLNNTLLGISALVISFVVDPVNINILWGKIRNKRNDITFDQFVLALDLLYVLGLININNNNIEKSTQLQDEHFDKGRVHEIIDFSNYCELRKMNKKDAIIPYILEICEVLKNDTA